MQKVAPELVETVLPKAADFVKTAIPKAAGAVEKQLQGKLPYLDDALRMIREKTTPRIAAGDEVAQSAGSTFSKLPKTTAESVSVKLDSYLLEVNHPVGGSKAKWFKEALGFTNDNSADLAKQIAFDPKKAVQTATNAHGTKFSQYISVQGANGKIIEVEFIFIKNNDGIIRLVTSIPTKR